MTECIYGIDPTKPVTPLMVRNAITECFYQAHEEILNQLKTNDAVITEKEKKEMGKDQIKILIETFFEEVGGDYQNPKKEELIKVCDKLANFAQSFRAPEIIKKHYDEIVGLINLIKSE
ncbi:hypothetical protein KKG71_04455 [Patescibacteria group bacterium]|nr:hypothetical protein [Patescibacteria group bacterium]